MCFIYIMLLLINEELPICFVRLNNPIRILKQQLYNIDISLV